jgi:hypothetical protein
MGWPRLGVRVAMLASGAAVLTIVAFAVVAFVGRGGGAEAAFNACISQPRFLVLVRHGSGNNVIEMIKDRAHGAVVGAFALLPSERAAEALTTTLAGFGARSDRYVVLTRVPALDPDATAIERCWDRTVVSAP